MVMKRVVSVVIFIMFAQLYTIAQNNPEKIVQIQLDAYNRQDVKAFVATYSDSIELYNFNATTPFLKGKAALEKSYADYFKKYPLNYAALHGRIIQGNYVIDKEYITGHKESFIASAIYYVENSLIRKVWFVQ
jgi:hypothetical protein